MPPCGQTAEQQCETPLTNLGQMDSFIQAGSHRIFFYIYTLGEHIIHSLIHNSCSKLC